MRKLFLLGLFLFFNCCLNAQNAYDSVHTEEGYLIYIRPAWIFQPCHDNGIDVLEAIDHESFVPGTFSYSFGMNLLPLEGMGERIFLKYCNNLENRNLQDTVYYFYCKIKLINSKDSSMNGAITPCWYKLFYRNKEIDLCCNYFSNAIYSVEPMEEKYRRSYLQYLRDNNYPLPDWSKSY